MSIAEIWKQEGFEEGFKKGFKEGFEEGFKEGRQLKLIEMTTKALESTFKDVPNEISEKMEQSDSATLEEFFLKLINDEFKNIDEVREFL